MSMSHDANSPPFLQLSEALFSMWKPQVIHAATKLGIVEILTKGPASAEAIAASIGAPTDTTARLLRALAFLDVCRKLADDCFELTESGRYLRADASPSLQSTALLLKLAWNAWGRLADCVRTGESAWKLDGIDFFKYLQENPEDGEVFNRSMVQLTQQIAASIAERYDFGKMRSIVDVGGGYGALALAIVAQHPHVRATILDLPHCKAPVERTIAEKGLEGRVEFVAGDFFAAVPRGADAYILKYVIHDWNDEESIRILSRCREATHDRSRLLLVEKCISGTPGSSSSDFLFIASDMNMLVNTGGRERTESEYRKLLESAGFRLQRMIPTPSGTHVMEAVVT